ncbi:uncharacterized protein LOC112885121 [Panicum hallii]|uniref:uncharacterized protein LOC112885121 n=1 Tax=Panicum hallii TaxID=206008 RepID=UPI000DF4D586|nr:uncharacterized protein LOC112885121 [Panicum hallii]
MEHIVESIRFPCPNAIHGCTARTTYYDQHFHCQTCPHRPCHCPSETCGFVGSTVAPLDHFNKAHGWPCTTKVKAATMNYKDDDDYEFKLQVHDGFDFLLADYATADSKQGTIHGGLYLFLLNAVSTFEVECMDLSNRLPNPDECFQFVVPKSVLAGGYTIEVGGQIVISWSM